MIRKKEIPLPLILAVEKIAKENSGLNSFKKEENTYYCFVDKDPDSEFYFRIFSDGAKALGNFKRGNFAYDWKPHNQITLTRSVTQGDLTSVVRQFNAWVSIVKEFNETPSLHDDPFVDKYADFYFTEFEILDDDANTHPFDPNQQDYLIAYFDSLKEEIQESDELDKSLLIELTGDIDELKEKLTSSTKNEVMKKLSRVYAKLYKRSKKLGGEIVNQAKKRLIMKLIDLGVEYGPKLLEWVASLAG